MILKYTNLYKSILVGSSTIFLLIVVATCYAQVPPRPINFRRIDDIHFQPEGIQLGLRTQITPYMWRDGKDMENISGLNVEQQNRWKFLQANVDRTREWGGRWNIVIVHQWLDTIEKFARIRRIINEHERRGLSVVLRVIEDPAVFDRLLQTESAEVGFDKSYFDWIAALASAFGNQVNCFLIGNESELDQGPYYNMWKSNAPNHVIIPYVHYAKLLKTAVRAVKSVNSRIQVANCGFSDLSLILALADSAYKSGDSDRAFQYWADWRGTGGLQIGGKQSLLDLINKSESQRKIAWLKQAIYEPMGSDFFQIHYYGSYKALQPILDWIHEEMKNGNADRPIIATEVGYRIFMNQSSGTDGKIRFEQDYSFYNENEHALNTVKNFSILLGNEVKIAMYWQMRETHCYGQAVRLFSPTENPFEFKATRASYAFRILGNTLYGLRLDKPKLSPTPGLREYHFIGRDDVSIVWSDSGKIRKSIDNVLKMIDLEGNQLPASDPTELNAEPKYVFWSSETIR